MTYSMYQERVLLYRTLLSFLPHQHRSILSASVSSCCRRGHRVLSVRPSVGLFPICLFKQSVKRNVRSLQPGPLHLQLLGTWQDFPEQRNSSDVSRVSPYSLAQSSEVSLNISPISSCVSLPNSPKYGS